MAALMEATEAGAAMVMVKMAVAAAAMRVAT